MADGHRIVLKTYKAYHAIESGFEGDRLNSNWIKKIYSILKIKPVAAQYRVISTWFQPQHFGSCTSIWSAKLFEPRAYYMVLLSLNPGL